MTKFEKGMRVRVKDNFPADVPGGIEEMSGLHGQEGVVVEVLTEFVGVRLDDYGPSQHVPWFLLVEELEVIEEEA